MHVAPFRLMRASLCCFLVASLAACAPQGDANGSAAPGSMLWTIRLATDTHDEASSVATDAFGNAYVVGSTRADIATGVSGHGSAQGYLAKIAGDGSVLWIRQFGSATSVFAASVAADEHGGVFVAGRTLRYREGDDAGDLEAFVRKHGSSGDLMWERQLGTVAEDEVRGVAVDGAGNLWVVGATKGDLAGPNAGQSDVFVRTYDTDGREGWTRQFGTAREDVATGVAVDEAGNGFVVGFTSGALDIASGALTDAFVRKYDPEGVALWTHQFGSGSTRYGDAAVGVAVDTVGRAVVVGYTAGDLASSDGHGGGLLDAFVRTYTADGVHVWTRQFGTRAAVAAQAVTVDALGRVFVAGSSLGAFEGLRSEGLRDVFVRAFDGDGDELWTRQIGTPGDDFAHGISVDATGKLILVGVNDAVRGDNSHAVRDAFVMKLEP